MKNMNLVDCLNLDLIQDIPEELIATQQYCNTLMSENESLKKAVIVLGVGISCLLVFNLMHYYGTKKKKDKENNSSFERAA